MTTRWMALLRRPGVDGTWRRHLSAVSTGSRLLVTSSSLYHPLGDTGAATTTSATGVAVASGQWRWRHSGKLGHRRETLDELAHRPEREAAQERRQKKKDKAALKKGHATVGATLTSSSSSTDHADTTDPHHLDFLSDNEDHHYGEDEDLENNGEDETLEPTLPDLRKVEGQMMLYVERLQESFQSIRGAEPTAEMFDDISVLAYGSPTPLKAVGQVVIVSPTLAQITCFDPSVAKDVQKAIQLALQDVNPQLEDASTGTIKVPLPKVSMEVREQTAKQLKQKAEATKQRIRQVRRKAMDIMKKAKDGKIPGISKDDAFASAKELDTMTETVTDRLQKLVDEKIKSIMAI